MVVLFFNGIFKIV